MQKNDNHDIVLPGLCTYENDWGGAAGSTSGMLSWSYLNRGGIRRPKPRTPWINPTPYQLVSRKVNSGSGTCSRTWQSLSNAKKKYFDRYHGVVGGGNGAPVNYGNFAHTVVPEGGYPGVRAYLQDMTYRSCYTKMRAATVNVGVAFAEAGKTAGLVADTARRISWAVYLLRKGRWKQAAAVLGVNPGRYHKNWAKKWLEWHYGWVPMLNDIYMSAVHLAQRDAGSWRTSVSSKMERPIAGFGIVGVGFSRSMVSCSGFVGVQTRFDFIPSGQFEPSKLGLTNPALLVWELLPYSFCVDWIVPVGDWLQGLDHSVAIAGGVSCISTIVKQKWSVSGLNDEQVAGDYLLSYVNAHSGTVEYTSLSRTVGTVDPPSFPSLRNPIPNLRRMITAVALMRNAFK